MKRAFVVLGVTVGAAALALWLIATRAATKEGGAATAGDPVAQTPLTADGKPDLSGVWAGGGAGDVKPDAEGNLTVLTKGRPCHPGQSECAPGINFERDSGVRQR